MITKWQRHQYSINKNVHSLLYEKREATNKNQSEFYKNNYANSISKSQKANERIKMIKNIFNSIKPKVESESRNKNFSSYSSLYDYKGLRKKFSLDSQTSRQIIINIKKECGYPKSNKLFDKIEKIIKDKSKIKKSRVLTLPKISSIKMFQGRNASNLIASKNHNFYSLYDKVVSFDNSENLKTRYIQMGYVKSVVDKVIKTRKILKETGNLNDYISRKIKFNVKNMQISGIKSCSLTAKELIQRLNNSGFYGLKCNKKNINRGYE